jgi:antitoxin HicB
MLAYPARLKKQPEGGFLIKFRDVPEALAQGGTKEEALGLGESALITALGVYMEEGKPIPLPSEPRRGEILIPLRVENTCRVMFYEAMRRKAFTVKDVAEKMGVTVYKAKKLLHVTSQTTLDDLVRVALALDMQVISQIR